MKSAAQKHGVDPALIHQMIRQESAGNPRAQSPVGAQGLMQLMPPTARDLGVKDPFDPAQNIDGGSRYMAQLLKRYGGDRNKALAAYNAGMGNVDSGKAAGFKETNDYVARIGGRMDAPFEAFAQDAAPAQAAPQAMPPAMAPMASHTTQAAPVEAEDDFATWRASRQASPAAPSQGERTWTDTAVDALPAIGGFAGGIAGALGGGLPTFGLGAVGGGVAGATVFGGAGEALRQTINRIRGKEAPGTSAEAALDIVKAGGFEGGAQAVGGAAGKYVFAPAARALTKGAFRPTAEALSINPNLTQDILENGIALSRKGAERARGMTSASRQVADQMVDDLQTQPRRFIVDPQGRTIASNAANVEAELINPVFRSTSQIGGGTGQNALGAILQGADNQPALRMADDVADSVRQSLGSKTNVRATVDPKRLHEIKRAEGRKASAVFTDTPDVATRKGFNADLHNAADEALGRRIGPKWGAANKETQRRLTTQKVVEDALKKQSADVPGINPYDQFLLMRGVAKGDPLSVGIALAREAGRVRPLVAAAGRGAHKFGKANVVGQTIRGTGALVNEDSKARKQRAQFNRRKPEIDALWEKFQNQ